VKNIVDFTRPVNPLGMPQAVREALLNTVQSGLPEPFDGEFTDLRETIAVRHRAQLSQIAVSRVEEELITLLAVSCGAKRALLPMPCPESYKRAMVRAGATVKELRLSPRHNYRLVHGELREALRGCDLLLMGNPAYPSGALVPPAQLLEEVEEWASRGNWMIVDESMLDFTYGGIANSVWSGFRHVSRAALIRSFTASLALDACPLCYAVGGAGWLAQVRSLQFQPALSPLAACLTHALEKLISFRSDTIDSVAELRNKFVGRLRRVSGLRPFPSDANWVLCSFERNDMTLRELADQLRRRWIIVEPCIDDAHVALPLRPAADVDRFIRTVREILMPKKDYQKMLPLA